MSNISDNVHSSSRFDTRLITMGNWDIDNYELFNIWLDQSSIDFKRKKAGEILIKLVDNILKEDITYDGRIRISYLYDLISSLENLVFTTRSLNNKFYRDHLNHALRVAIMARVIAVNEPFNLKEDELGHLILSCLFHDLAYPLTDVVKIFDSTAKALKKCYFLANDYRLQILTDEKKESNYIYDYVSETKVRIKGLLDKRNHGIYSALEFIYHLKKDTAIVKKYKEVINAIAIHDSACRSMVNIEKDKIASILIISDELQDWGRISVGGTKTIDRIERFEVKENTISGEFPHVNDQKFSTLKQIAGKMCNFERLKLDKDKLIIYLKFNTSNFTRIDMSEYHEILKILFNMCDNKHIINPLTNSVISNSPYFERRLYGISLNDDIKLEVYDSLSKNIKIKEKKYLYLNTNNNETILSDIEINQLDRFIITNRDNDGIKLNVNVGTSLVNSSIHGSDDENNSRYYQLLVTRIRFIHYLIYTIIGVFDNYAKTRVKVESYVDLDMLESLSGTMSETEFYKRYVNLHINQILNSIRMGNNFVLNEITS